MGWADKFSMFLILLTFGWGLYSLTGKRAPSLESQYNQVYTKLGVMADKNRDGVLSIEELGEVYRSAGKVYDYKNSNPKDDLNRSDLEKAIFAITSEDNQIINLEKESPLLNRL